MGEISGNAVIDPTLFSSLDNALKPEMELESLRAMLISIDVGAQVEVSFCVSAAEPLCGLRAHFQGLEWEQDEDGLQYVTRKLERSRR